MYKKEMNKRLDKRSDLIDAFYDYPSGIRDQIVYLDPNESILPEVIEVINSFRYELTMSFENDKGEQDFLFTNGEQAILVRQSRKLGAIFIDTRGTDGVIEQVLSHKCLECSSEDIVESILHAQRSEVDEKLVEMGALDYLGTFDRLGVPQPNYRCKKCGFRWHHLRDMVRKDRSVLYKTLLEKSNQDLNC